MTRLCFISSPVMNPEHSFADTRIAPNQHRGSEVLSFVKRMKKVILHNINVLMQHAVVSAGNTRREMPLLSMLRNTIKS